MCCTEIYIKIELGLVLCALKLTHISNLLIRFFKLIKNLTSFTCHLLKFMSTTILITRKYCVVVWKRGEFVNTIFHLHTKSSQIKTNITRKSFHQNANQKISLSFIQFISFVRSLLLLQINHNELLNSILNNGFKRWRNNKWKK